MLCSGRFLSDFSSAESSESIKPLGWAAGTRGLGLVLYWNMQLVSVLLYLHRMTCTRHMQYTKLSIPLTAYTCFPYVIIRSRLQSIDELPLLNLDWHCYGHVTAKFERPFCVQNRFDRLQFVLKINFLCRKCIDNGETLDFYDPFISDKNWT